MSFSCQQIKKDQNSSLEKRTEFSRVIVGAEQLFSSEFFSKIQNKRIGLITNHTGLLPDGQHIIDVLYKHPEVELTLLFGPEHGLRGEEDNHVEHGMDAETGLKIISLYGKTRKPTAEMLAQVDVLIFDIQDIGARYYTYIKTMLWAQEAAAENEVPFLVLDRPNPIGGEYVDGPVEPIAENGAIPITHGMTVGELARMFNGNRKVNGLVEADLTVIPMKNYGRQQWYDDTGLPWIKPSPNMLTLKTATMYPATCLIEGTNISDGRGTMRPFEQIGAPWIDGNKLAEQLNSYQLRGIEFKPIRFVPDSIVDGIKFYPPKFLGEEVKGIEMVVTDRNSFKSAQAGIYILHALRTLYHERLELRQPRLDGLLGTPEVRLKLESGESPKTIIEDWAMAVDSFKQKGKPYLLY
ncbi:exo-beta-N-acetylmuramidase NamZ family protein [Gelidibacter maritimus]|uniref:DUF1343 domain-containing protein n=1 Tax=Gelidibacter maritimus TaxID=2761487 RepID=A0A7W2M753_9FLAO|nr:DUF1343 domain-containing protein [Gelidibacter maritimus]MBA6153857.1 DUF1343 domain-containing protein [Gelidibacter maritimus]